MNALAFKNKNAVYVSPHLSHILICGFMRQLKHRIVCQVVYNPSSRATVTVKGFVTFFKDNHDNIRLSSLKIYPL